MRFWITTAFLAYIAFRAFRDGGQPEKYAAASFVIPFITEALLNKIYGRPSFAAISPMRLCLDIGVFVSLISIALRANRWWPLWTGGLQLIVISGHVAAFMYVPAIRGVYWMMTVFPYYFEYLILLLGISCHARRVAIFGNYGDWTPKVDRSALN